MDQIQHRQKRPRTCSMPAQSPRRFTPSSMLSAPLPDPVQSDEFCHSRDTASSALLPLPSFTPFVANSPFMVPGATHSAIYADSAANTVSPSSLHYSPAAPIHPERHLPSPQAPAPFSGSSHEIHSPLRSARRMSSKNAASKQATIHQPGSSLSLAPSSLYGSPLDPDGDSASYTLALQLQAQFDEEEKQHSKAAKLQELQDKKFSQQLAISDGFYDDPSDLSVVDSASDASLAYELQDQYFQQATAAGQQPSLPLPDQSSSMRLPDHSPPSLPLPEPFLGARDSELPCEKIDVAAAMPALKEYSQRVHNISCSSCGTKLVQSSFDAAQLLDLWRNDKAAMDSPLQCKSCFAHTCGGCGSQAAPHSARPKAVKPEDLHWCCEMSRVLTIWILVSAFEHQKQKQAKADMARPKAQIEPTKSAASTPQKYRQPRGVGYEGRGQSSPPPASVSSHQHFSHPSQSGHGPPVIHYSQFSDDPHFFDHMTTNPSVAHHWPANLAPYKPLQKQVSNTLNHKTLQMTSPQPNGVPSGPAPAPVHLPHQGHSSIFGPDEQMKNALTSEHKNNKEIHSSPHQSKPIWPPFPGPNQLTYPTLDVEAHYKSLAVNINDQIASITGHQSNSKASSNAALLQQDVAPLNSNLVQPMVDSNLVNHQPSSAYSPPSSKAIMRYFDEYGNEIVNDRDLFAKAPVTAPSAPSAYSQTKQQSGYDSGYDSGLSSGFSSGFSSGYGHPHPSTAFLDWDGQHFDSGSEPPAKSKAPQLGEWYATTPKHKNVSKGLKLHLNEVNTLLPIPLMGQPGPPLIGHPGLYHGQLPTAHNWQSYNVNPNQGAHDVPQDHHSASHKSRRGRRSDARFLDRAAKEAQTASDNLFSAILDFLCLVLPTSSYSTAFDLEPPPAVFPMLAFSSIVDEAAELLRNDSISDATSRRDLYHSLIGFVSRLCKHHTTLDIVLRERPEKAWRAKLLDADAHKRSASCGEYVASIAASMKNSVQQSRIMLRNARANPEELASEETQEMLVLCNRMTELADEVSTATLFVPVAPQTRKPVDKAHEWHEWQKANCMLDVCDEVMFAAHRYAVEAKALTQAPKGRMKRLMEECANLSTSLPPGVFVRYASSRPDVLKMLIVGPAGTPYEGGLFEFDAWCPSNYPHEPPRFTFRTTGRGRGRMNPNLYEDGKVCLSLLNTWPGQRWRPNESTLLQVLVSLQSMVFCDQPYYNEPGFESYGSTDEAKRYNNRVQGLTVRLAMKQWLETSEQTVWGSVIREHFARNGGEILKVARGWANTNPGLRKADVDGLEKAMQQLLKPSSESAPQEAQA